jgi:hypothetical protein
MHLLPPDQHLRCHCRHRRLRNVKFLNSTQIPKFDLDDDDVRNNTGMSWEAARATLAADGAVEISYDDYRLVVERSALEDARKMVAEVSPEKRQLFMQSIDEELHKNFPIIEAGKATKEIYDAVRSDLLLWTAFQEYAQ